MTDAEDGRQGASMTVGADPALPLTLCVLLWSRQGREQDLSKYEDAVLALLGDHGGHVVQRVRSVDVPGPTEVHILRFDSPQLLDSYMADPRRVALGADRDASVERTQILRVESVD